MMGYDSKTLDCFVVLRYHGIDIVYTFALEIYGYPDAPFLVGPTYHLFFGIDIISDLPLGNYLMLFYLTSDDGLRPANIAMPMYII